MERGSPALPSTWGRLGRAIVPVGLLVLFGGLALGSLADEAPTIDEHQHLAAGYSYLETGDFRFGRDHPPLVKMLAAAPLLFLQLRSVESYPAWAAHDRPTFDRKFFLRNSVSPWRMLFLARLPIVAIGVLMGTVVFAWGRALWGYWPGVLALFLYVFCPNVLAHTRLVTTDAGIACFTVLTMFLVWRSARSGRARDAVAAGIALGCALLAKYTGLLTAAAVVVCLPLLAEEAAGGRSRITHSLLLLVIVLLTATAVVTIGFGFPQGLSNYAAGVREFLGGWRPEVRHKWSFLWGAHSANGFWHYYLLAQLWKTPLPALVLFAWALVIIARAPAVWRDAAFLLVPIGVFHAAGMLSEVNIGIRHVLPVFPFMFVAGGAVAWRLTRGAAGPAHADDSEQGAARGRSRIPGCLVLLALCAWSAAGTLRAAPHFIAYFNELVGGPERGVHYLDDSNIDWGQDLFRLRRYLEEGRPEDVHLAVFAPLSPRAYGIAAAPFGLRDLVWPQPGVTYAVSADYLQRHSLRGGNTALRLDWLRRYRPIAKVGWSIFVYRFSLDPADRERSDVYYLPRSRWYEEAIASLHAILAQSPDFGEARALLAEVEAAQAGSMTGPAR